MEGDDNCSPPKIGFLPASVLRRAAVITADGHSRRTLWFSYMKRKVGLLLSPERFNFGTRLSSDGRWVVLDLLGGDVFRYPTHEERPAVMFWVKAALVILPLFLGLMTFIGLPATLEEGPLLFGMVLCFDLITLGLLLASVDIFKRIRRGPPRDAPTEVGSGEGMHLVVLVAAGLAFLAGAFGMTHGLRGEEVEARGFLMALTAGLYLMAGLLLFGALSVVWQLATRGRSTLRIAENPIPAGERFDAILEIPFPAARRMRLRLELQLYRMEAAPSADESGTTTTVWTDERIVTADRAVGDKRSATSISFVMPDGRPSDIDDSRVSYGWSLKVVPIDEKTTWTTEFGLPVKFEAAGSES